MGIKMQPPNRNTLKTTCSLAIACLCYTIDVQASTDYLIADAGDATGGHSFTRAVALLDEGTVVFVDVVDGAKSTTLDVAYHQRGAWGDLPAGDAWQPPEKPGYLHLTQATIRTTRDLARLPLAHAAAPKCEIIVAGGAPLEIITAMGIGRGLGDPVPTVIWDLSPDSPGLKVE
jgi:hypothetical protein